MSVHSSFESDPCRPPLTEQMYTKLLPESPLFIASRFSIPNPLVGHPRPGSHLPTAAPIPQRYGVTTISSAPQSTGSDIQVADDPVSQYVPARVNVAVLG